MRQFCPLINSSCAEGRCAWWDGDAKACSIWVLASVVDEIVAGLDDIAQKIRERE